MSKARRDFIDILIRNDVPVPDRVIERLTRGTGVTLQEPLVLWHYASEAEVLQGLAEFHNYPFIDLTGVEISRAIIELVPESMARERIVLPFELEGNVIKIVVSDPTNKDLLPVLSFILNREVQPIIALQEQIQQSVDQHYGQFQTDSVDSVLTEFLCVSST